STLARYGALPSDLMKLAIVGAGSTYAPVVIDEIARANNDGLLHASLFDLRNDFTQLIAGSTLWDTCDTVTVEASSGLAECVEGADAIVVMLRAGPIGVRRQLEALAIQNGLLAQETQGICGFLSALLNISALVEVA